MKRLSTLFVLSASLAGPALYAQAPPRFVTFSLAGKDMRNAKESEDMTALNDKKKSYYLITQTYKNTSRTLLLIKPQELKNDPTELLKNLKVRQGNLPSLATGNGVAIGSSESAVVSKLGKPTSIETGPEPKERTLFYLYEGGRIYGWSYGAWYRLKSGKVTSISIFSEKGAQLSG